jgi:hypothetical protein
MDRCQELFLHKLSYINSGRIQLLLHSNRTPRNSLAKLSRLWAGSKLRFVKLFTRKNNRIASEERLHYTL